MRRFLTAALLGAGALSASACAEVYHGYFGYGDMREAQPSIPFDGGEITTNLDVRVNQYSGNVIGVKVLYGVRNTSSTDRCVSVTFAPDDVRTYGVPARIPVHVRRGQSVGLPIELWAREAPNQHTWPAPSAYSTVATSEACS